MKTDDHQFLEQQLKAMQADEEKRVQELGDVRAAGEAALRLLFDVAHGHSGQSKVIARFLLGCYNGQRFPFDLTDFRVIDHGLFEDCLTVLKMDASPLQEVHCYFKDGGQRFEALAQNWRIEDIAGMSADLKRYREQNGPL